MSLELMPWSWENAANGFCQEFDRFILVHISGS